MSYDKRMTETESEDYANEQAENRFALEVMSPMELSIDSIVELDVNNLLASDSDDLEILSDEFSDYLDTLDAENDEFERTMAASDD